MNKPNHAARNKSKFRVSTVHYAVSCPVPTLFYLMTYCTAGQFSSSSTAAVDLLSRSCNPMDHVHPTSTSCLFYTSPVGEPAMCLNNQSAIQHVLLPRLKLSSVSACSYLRSKDSAPRSSACSGTPCAPRRGMKVPSPRDAVQS